MSLLFAPGFKMNNKDIQTFNVAQDAQEIGATVRNSQNAQTPPVSGNVNQLSVNGQAAPQSSNGNQLPINGKAAPQSSSVNQHPVNSQTSPQSSNMNQQKDNLPKLCAHMAVIHQDVAYVFGGFIDKGNGLCRQSADEIWKYNLYTEKWKNEKVKGDEDTIKMLTRSLVGCCAVSIDTDIYVFGVAKDEMAILWKLHRDEKGSLSWVEVRVNESPSRRHCMTGWEFEKCLYIFGGLGLPPADVSDLNGIFILCFTDRIKGSNNQLLCFDPSCEEWSTTKSDGAVPSPRFDHSTTKIGNTVWLYGGRSYPGKGQYLNDLYQLNMKTSTDAFTWTQIEIKPLPIMHSPSMTAIASNKLAIHDYGIELNNERAMTWILDLTTMSWREYASTTDHYRLGHTSVTGLSDSVIIIGGDNRNKQRSHSFTFCIKLQPKSLEQLAARAVHKHQTTPPWEEVLPTKLVCKIMGRTT